MKQTHIVLYSIIALMIMLPVLAADDKASALQLSFISQRPDPVEPGQYVELRWRVANQGGASQDYTFEIRPEYPFTVDGNTPRIINQATVGSYEPTDSGATIFFRVRVDPNAVEGSNTIKLFYYKSDKSTTEYFIEQSVRVEGRKGLVELAKYQTNPQSVKVGTLFNITLDVENLGSSFVNNVKLTLDTKDTPFTPIGSSNQKTIKTINANSKATYTFQYSVDADADIKVHAVPVTIDYTDSLNRDNSVSTKIGIVVDAQTEYLANLQQSDVWKASKTGKVVTSISNIGKANLNFVVLELQESEDYKIISSAKEYLGNLESDDFETGQFEIYIPATDKKSVPLQFRIFYRDAYDQPHNERFTLNNVLYTSEEAIAIGKEQPANYTVLVVLVIIIAIGIFFFMRRSSKAKKQQFN